MRDLLRHPKLGWAVVAGAGLGLASCSDSNPEQAADQACRQRASEVGIELSEAPPQVRIEADGSLRLAYGEAACRVQLPSRVLSLVNVSSRRHDGAPVLKSSLQAIQAARNRLAGSSVTLAEPIQVRPAEPWGAHHRLVTLACEPEAFGYPTGGYAGRTTVTLDRFTGKVVEVSQDEGPTPDRPNLQITEDRARQIAMPLWRASRYYTDQDIVLRANLQYYHSP
jgi:hypothetical protein